MQYTPPSSAFGKLEEVSVYTQIGLSGPKREHSGHAHSLLCFEVQIILSMN